MKALRLLVLAAVLGTIQPELAAAQRSSPSAESGGVVNRSRDCHRNVIRHRIYGRMLAHRHVGSDCRVQIVRDRDNRRERCKILNGRRVCRN